MEAKENAQKLFKKVGTFILSCVGEDGYPLTKAVVPGKYRDSISEIYFCTNTSSKFANAIKANEKASVYFYSKNIVWQGCILKGKMSIVEDKEVKKKYWQDKFKNAYPEKAYTDPDFCVLKFIPESGRYYAWFKPQDFTI